MLCAVCKRSIQLELERSQRGGNSENTHHVSRESVKLSALKGCMVCVAIENSLQQYSEPRAIDSTRPPRKAPSVFISKLRVSKRGGDSAEDPISRTYLVSTDTHVRLQFRDRIDFYLVHSSLVDPLRPLIGLNPRPKNSEKGRQLVLTWLKQCQNHHVKCNTNRSASWCPSRLLDLTSLEEGRIRLISPTSKAVHRQYMTLSHRWGVKPSLRLTRDNETWMKSGFSISYLPQTFRDAAQLVWQLGAPYLWIDSLCIQQDCIEDWQRESNQMGDIYKFSLCNIGATGTADESGGLCWREGPSESLVDRIDLDVDAETVPFHIIRWNFWDRLNHEIINKRAWVLQERYLAPSMIHVASEQIFWECHEFNACQTFPLGIPDEFLRQTLRSVERLPEDETVGEFNHFDEAYDSSDERLKALSIWHSLSGPYTGYELTYAEDKLVALSGLANEFQTSVKANYLAGLWDFHLVPQLLWEVLEPKEPISKYRAPSWSWASVEGRLNGSTSCHLGGELVDIIEASVENSDNHRNGAVKSGFLKVRGSITEVKLYKVPEDSPESTTSPRFNPDIVAKDLAGNNMWIGVKIDHLVTTAFFEKEFVCLPLQYYFYDGTEEHGRPTMEGLILESAGTAQGYFRRVGLFYESEREGVASAFRTDLMLTQDLYIV